MRQKFMEKTSMIAAATLGKNSAARITDPERRRDENDHETSPRQREPILQMGRERREQGRRKIGIEMQIIAQLRDARGIPRARLRCSDGTAFHSSR